jgi:adenosylcobinamide-GDP ribazoletransferase
MMNVLKSIVAALQFMTILPLPIKTDHNHLTRSITWFPLAGMVVGGLCGAGLIGFNRVFDPAIASVLVVALYLILTRGLHMDGFMDTIDGFFSRKPKEKILAIMKESTVGSFAVLGAGVWFLIAFTTLPYMQWLDLIVIHGLARYAIILQPLIFSYPRQSGTGKFFVENTKKSAFIIELILIAAALWFLNPSYLVCLGISLVVSLCVGAWSKRMIGGITGDTTGFTIEAVHLLLLLYLTIKL